MSIFWFIRFFCLCFGGWGVFCFFFLGWGGCGVWGVGFWVGGGGLRTSSGMCFNVMWLGCLVFLGFVFWGWCWGFWLGWFVFFLGFLVGQGCLAWWGLVWVVFGGGGGLGGGGGGGGGWGGVVGGIRYVWVLCWGFFWVWGGEKATRFNSNKPLGFGRRCKLMEKTVQYGDKRQERWKFNKNHWNMADVVEGMFVQN